MRPEGQVDPKDKPMLGDLTDQRINSLDLMRKIWRWIAL